MNSLRLGRGRPVNRGESLSAAGLCLQLYGCCLGQQTWHWSSVCTAW